MRTRRRRILLLAAAALIALLIGSRAAVLLYTDGLWYASAGYVSVFWKRLGAAAVVRLVAMLVGGGIVLANLATVVRRMGAVQLRRRYGNLEISEQVPRSYLVLLVVLASVLAGWWLAALEFGGEAGISVLAWLRRVPWGTTDPIFHHDLAFYVFSLPTYQHFTAFLLLALLWSLALVAVGYGLLGMLRWEERRLQVTPQARVHLIALAALILLAIAARAWLGRYEILLADADGVGFTDVQARLPAATAVAVLTAAAALAVAYAGWRSRWVPALAALATLAVGGFVLEQVYPGIVQRFTVEPNQLARETPYIRSNIDFTRRAYGLDRLKRERFAYVSSSLPEWSRMKRRIERVSVWDLEPLKTNFNQAQPIYTYYHFPDVDFDRYGPPGGERQVGISAREFEPSPLPPATRTWQTLHLNPQFIRGRGAVLTPADEGSAQGEPVYWIENINPIRRSPEAPPDVEIRNASVFFGQSMGEYAVVVPGRDSAFTGVPGRDYPRGVRLGSLPRLAAFALRFGEKNLLFSSEISRSSRIVFHRIVRRRLSEVARWVIWDTDPYPVLTGGRLVWVVDGFTASGTFPLAHPVDMPNVGRVRYLRNSVKGTVDAVTGAVSLYAIDPSDPILRTFERVFPGLVQPLDSMPLPLRRHLRYPAALLQIQADILDAYHLNSAADFFAGQDVWAVANEAGAEGVPRPYMPTFLLAPMPGDSQPEFLLTMPFVARQRHNMTALLIARNDPPHYGEVTLLELPRDQQVPGPTQVHALIEQDAQISQALSLWRQAGSTVDVGHLRLVPVDSGFLYVLPLYLSAKEGAIPILGRVVVSDGRAVALGTTLETATEALSKGAPGSLPQLEETGPPGLTPGLDWPARALELMKDAEDRLRTGDWAGFGTAWNRLRGYLRDLGNTPPAAPSTPSG